jgi:hypothetical protein
MLIWPILPSNSQLPLMSLISRMMVSMNSFQKFKERRRFWLPPWV